MRARLLVCKRPVPHPAAHLHTMHASLPPSSICMGTMPAFRQMAMPVSPPVKLMQLTPGCWVR